MSAVKITDRISAVPVLNPAMRIFDVVMKTDYGTSYNSYIVKGDSKSALIETAHATFFSQYVETIKSVCDPGEIEYIVLNHCEPDHSGALKELLDLCPNAKIYVSRAGSIYLKGITNRDDLPVIIAKDGDSIELYFTSDWTSEPGAEGWQKPGKIETIVNADGSVTKIETKSDGTVIETTTWRDGSTLTAETSPNGRVETVEKRAYCTTVETVESASGEITASVSVPKSVGSTRVDIPVSKPTGSMVAVIVHPDGTEEIVRGSVVTETGVALRAEGDVRLKIIDNAKRFNDMADHWAKDAVEFASSRELFNGVGNDAFGPDFSMTRGMVSTVLARLAGADTAGGETWYAKGTVWAVENGISDGTAPEQPVTREQLAAMLYRYAGSPAVSGELSFDDTTVISIWAYDAVRWCVDNGILNGVGGNRMTPQDLARRGQVAAMLMRFLQATV